MQYTNDASYTQRDTHTQIPTNCVILTDIAYFWWDGMRWNSAIWDHCHCSMKKITKIIFWILSILLVLFVSSRSIYSWLYAWILNHNVFAKVKNWLFTFRIKNGNIHITECLWQITKSHDAYYKKYYHLVFGTRNKKSKINLFEIPNRRWLIDEIIHHNR